MTLSVVSKNNDSNDKSKPESVSVHGSAASHKEKGGGYLVEYPDIPGYMSGGEAIEEASMNGRVIPKPSIEAAQLPQRLPKTLYAELTKLAKNEGVSINSLVTVTIAEALGSRRPR